MIRTGTDSIWWNLEENCGVPSHSDWLSSAECEVISRLFVEKRCKDWKLGRYAAKNAVLAFLGEPQGTECLRRVEIRPAVDGAPQVFLDGELASMQISLSHAAGWGFCAVSEQHPVGCDVEEVVNRHESLARDFFTNGELEWVNQADREELALRTNLVWSAKESVLKVLRQGLRRDTRTVEVGFGLGTSLVPGDGWRRYEACCLLTGVEFGGWWRLNSGTVLTVAAHSRSAPPNA